ncbi:MAG: choice-of-anchor Q domain-containing protein, partial [Acidobacteriota bacterium]
ALRLGNNEVTVTIIDSLFYGNRASHENGNGGGILALGTTPDVDLTIHNTTFSGNRSNDAGGGLKLIANATATITDSTFTGNTANFDGDGFEGGGGISTGSGFVTITNSIVAGNFVDGASTATDLENSTYSSLGYNFIGDNTGAAAAFPAGNPNANDDYVGTGADPLDPLLDPLADNGGPTMSHLPDLAASPVIDTGSCTGSVADQRGFGDPNTLVRIVDAPGVPAVDDGCDVGAVEAFAEAIAGPAIFADGFESGDTASWSDTIP